MILQEKGIYDPFHSGRQTNHSLSGVFEDVERNLWSKLFFFKTEFGMGTSDDAFEVFVTLIVLSDENNVTKKIVASSDTKLDSEK